MDDIHSPTISTSLQLSKRQLKEQDAKTTVTEHGDLEPRSDSPVQDIYISVPPNSTTFQIAQTKNEPLVTDPIYPHNPSTAIEFIHRVPYDLD